MICFLSYPYFVFRDKPLNTKEGKSDADKSEEHFQKRVEDAVREMNTWDWEASGNGFQGIAESLVPDCRLIYKLSDC